LAGISEQSLVNGPGLRKVYFSQGCLHHCKGCFNPETWAFNKGKVFKINELLKDLEKEAPYLDGITFSGGDPMEQYDKFAKIVKLVKKFKLSIWSWTGYTWEELLLKAKEDKNFLSYLKTLDVVVDGRFILSLKSDTVKYRGSSNQRIIDVKKSLKANKVIQVIV